MQITTNTIFTFSTRQDDLKVVYRDKEKAAKVIIYLKPNAIEGTGFSIDFILNYKGKGKCVIEEEKSFPYLLAECVENLALESEEEIAYIRTNISPLLMEWMWLLELLNTLERLDYADETYLKNIAKVLEVKPNKDIVTKKLMDELTKHEPFEKLGTV